MTLFPGTRTKQILCIAACSTLMATGCMKDAGTAPGSQLPPKDALFGFDTRANTTLVIDYGVPGFQAQFKIFAENPLKYNDGSLTLKDGIEPIYTAYTDKDGKFNDQISLPGAVKTAYLYTDRLGVSSCAKLDLASGSASYLPKAEKMQASARSASSAFSMTSWFPGTAPYSITNNGGRYDQPGNIRSICKWTVNGRISGQNPAKDVYITESINGSSVAAISERVQEFLSTVDKGAGRAELLIKQPEVANVTIKEAGTTLQVVFVDERGAYTNTFGYYYYKKNKAPRKSYLADDLKALQKYIVFPHASGDALSVGETVSLQFFGENGDQSGSYEFPADYVVGWFLVPNGFITSDKHTALPQYAIIDGIRPNDDYKNSWGMMNSSNDTKTSTIDFRRFITLNDKASHSLVIGVEDVKNEVAPDDYCDLSFIITSNKSLDNDNLPEIPDVPVVPKEDKSFFGTLAFEDIWPYGGDYDLNDVVVEYSWNIAFDKDNNATSLEEIYTPVNNGAQYQNLFAYELPYGVVSLGAGMRQENATNSVIINDNVEDALNKSFSVKRTFSSKISKDALKEAFNPYIIVDRTTNQDAGRKEVHLPKHQATSLADMSIVNTADDAYYMKKDGKYPFAINIPVLGFKLATETIAIDKEYPGFRLWADSNGTTNSNWYQK